MLNYLKSIYVGRKIQWISRGQELFPQPRACIKVDAYYGYQDEAPKYFVFVKGINTGIPIEEVRIA